MKFALVLVATAACVSGQSATAPTVKVLNGTIKGSKCSSTNVNAFHSIPFAQPPVGQLRFAAPRPWNTTYSGTLDGTKAASACPQFNTGFTDNTTPSEDCLFVDVWAPANATSTSKLPVKVWLYGGSNKAGGISDPLYDGCFASTNVIQVSINYRVGPLGFLAYSPAGLTGNYGTQDQLLGLRWVQDNIAAFGGDPSRVLLYGQSAGGRNTWVLSSLPQAKSLIHSAILQSGNYADLETVAQATKTLTPFVSSINCTTSSLACLRSTSLDVMTTAFVNAAVSPFGPVVDGTTVTAQPGGPIVPSIIGSTADERTLFVLGQHGTDFTTLNQSAYYSYLLTLFSASSAQQINATYPVSLYASQPYPVFSAMSAALSYSLFRCPARRIAVSAANRGVPVWQYSFNHAPSCDWYASIPNKKATLALLGATHTVDIPFVFGQVDNLPRPDGTCNFTSTEKQLSALLLTAWDNMAADANPGSNWPAFTVAGSKGLNIVGDTWKFETINSTACDFWDKIALAESSGTAAVTGTATSTAPAISATTTGNAASKSRSFIPSFLWSTCVFWPVCIFF